MGLGHSLHCEQKSSQHEQHEQHEHWTTCSTCPKDGDDFLIDDNNFPLITIMMSSIHNMGAFGWFLQEWKLFSCSTGGNDPCDCHHLQEPRWGMSANAIIGGAEEDPKDLSTCWSGHQSLSKQSKPLLTRTKWKLVLRSQLLGQNGKSQIVKKVHEERKPQATSDKTEDKINYGGHPLSKF